ncbi:MAG: hypothetical protein B7733_11105, partial [Myxococcales bacterium FL481]
MSWIDQLARDFDDGTARAPDPARRQRQRNRFVAASVRRPVVRRRGASRFALGLGVLAVASAVAVVVWRGSTALNTGRPNESARDPGLVARAWLEADDGTPRRFALGHGGYLELAAAARARVVSASSDRVHVSLENGAANVVQGPGTHAGAPRIEVDAGPMRVSTQAGSFAVRWDAAVHHVALGVVAGSVEVSGGPLASSKVTMVAGKRLDVVGDEVHLTEAGDRARDVAQPGRFESSPAA